MLSGSKSDLLIAVNRLIGIPSRSWFWSFVDDKLIGPSGTGSAGLINTIHAFATGSILTGVFGVLATVSSA